MNTPYIINSENKIKTESGNYLNRPSIYFDYKNNILFAIGEFEKLTEIMTYENYIFAKINKPSYVTVIELTQLPPKMICYILCKAKIYNKSGFLIKLYETITKTPNEIKNWVQNEMNHEPIKI